MAVVDDVATARWRAGGRTQPLLRGWIHLCAIPVAVAAALLLVSMAPDPIARVAAVVYGVTVCAVFTVSALYHRVRWHWVAHLRMRRLDHGTIFLMIAGTFTPLCVLALGGATCVVLLSVVWTVAVAAFVLSVTGIADRTPVVANACYVGLAGMGLVVIPALIGPLEGWQLLLITVGGVLYSVGAVCLATGRPDPFPATFGYHEIWHALVVVACACQYVVIVSLVRAG
ncbi:MAG TPA: hemolysin III family protein [Acidimicrobiales bacterium]|nr:hemolysin III family protein [Acidimicrobiales bacterium]